MLQSPSGGTHLLKFPTCAELLRVLVHHDVPELRSIDQITGAVVRSWSDLTMDKTKRLKERQLCDLQIM